MIDRVGVGDDGRSLAAPDVTVSRRATALQRARLLLVCGGRGFATADGLRDGHLCRHSGRAPWGGCRAGLLLARSCGGLDS